MFYDKFEKLCVQKGISVTKASEEIGLARTIATKWKRTAATPRGETLVRIADYFGVSVSSLLDDPAESTKVSEEDAELLEYLEMLRTRKEARMLLSTVKGATKEEVEANVRVIEALRGVKKVEEKTD